MQRSPTPSGVPEVSDRSESHKGEDDDQNDIGHDCSNVACGIVGSFDATVGDVKLGFRGVEREVLNNFLAGLCLVEGKSGRICEDIRVVVLPLTGVCLDIRDGCTPLLLVAFALNPRAQSEHREKIQTTYMLLYTQRE